MGTPCLVGWYCSMHGPQLGKIIDNFSHPVACITPSGTKKAMEHKGTFTSLSLDFSTSTSSYYGYTEQLPALSEELLRLFWSTVHREYMSQLAPGVLFNNHHFRDQYYPPI